MKPFGIEKQIILVALLPILLMAVLLESYVIYSRFNDLDKGFLERSELLAHQLALTSEYEVFSGNKVALKQNAIGALTQHDISRVAVLDATAKPLVDIASKNQVQSESVLAKVNQSNPLYQDVDSLILYVPILSTPVKLDSRGFENLLEPVSSSPIGAVIVEISKQQLNNEKHEIVILSLAITLLVLIIALVLAMLSARKLSLPIIDMSQTIRSFGEGNLYARLTEQPEVAELQKLTEGFNQMAQRIQHHKEILEDTVKKRTAELAESELEYRTLVENTPDTIARYDKDCRRIYINPAFKNLSKGGGSELLGKRPSEFPGGPDSVIYEAKINEVFATGRIVHFDLKWQNKAGKEICSNIRLTAEHDQSGKVVSVLGVGHDVTELNDSKAELSRKELAKSRFLAAAGHDLRQPLAAANLFIDALRFTDLSPDQVHILQRLDQAMAMFNELLEALLNISKLDAGIIKPEYVSINVAEIFSWLAQSFTPMAQEKKLGFKLHCPKQEELVLHSDIDLVKSVLMNLVSNAIKYTVSGAVMVSARRRQNEALFQVWDTGIGIKEEHLQHIFDEFYQIDNPHRDRTHGLGLGLAISKRAISLLGSKISCRSKFGRGSVFEFRLPIKNSHGQNVLPSDLVLGLGKKNDVSFAQNKRFVVVEDDLLVSEAMCKTLEMMGGKVEYFHSAEEALLNAHDNEDCYIVDYMLAGTMNGIQLLNALRHNLNKPVIAVLMTGDTSPAFIAETEGFKWPVLHKPVNISALISGLKIQDK